MRIHLRGDNLSPSHLRFTVFANGGHAGTLTLTVQEAIEFKQALANGTRDDFASVLEVTGPWPLPPEQQQRRSR